MTGTRALVTLSVIVVATLLNGCAGDRPGQDAARAACSAYADTLRHQVATTVPQTDLIRARARSAADSAAQADTAWRPLRRDILDFFARQHALALNAPASDLAGYFAADRRVQSDCRSAGRDIGPLRP